MTIFIYAPIKIYYRLASPQLGKFIIHRIYKNNTQNF